MNYYTVYHQQMQLAFSDSSGSMSKSPCIIIIIIIIICGDEWMELELALAPAAEVHDLT